MAWKSMTEGRKHPLAKCEECPLAGRAGKFVPSVGPERAKLAFVGEAPGVQEARRGEPFVGPSGKLLNVVLQNYGIKREEVFLSNACLCRPPDNATPPRSAIRACSERLDRELVDHGVETVVALGNSAAESTLGRSGVTSLRVGPGRPHHRLGDVRVIPTLHPAACLRQADMFPSMYFDIGKVLKQHDVFTPPQYVVVDTRLDALRAIDELADREGPLAIDIEVHIEKDVSFEQPDRHGMLCVGISYARGRAVVFGERAMGEEEVRDRLGDLLAARKLIGHNGKFDLKGLYRRLGALKLWFDTMLASYTFDERPGIHRLKYLLVELLGWPQYDDEIKKYVGPHDGYGVIPRPILYKYNAYDVCGTYALWELFEARYKKAPELRRVHDLLVTASNELMFVELNGFAVDKDYLDVLTDKYLASLDEIEQELDKIVEKGGKGYDGRYKQGLNPRSPVQVKAYFADHRINVDSTDKDTLALLIEKLPDGEVKDFVSTLLRHRREAKMYGTYVKGIRTRMYRGRVYPTFLLHGTTTGRLACRNPNLQNIPRESSIRQLFVPSKPANVLIQTDYSQAELRVLSYLAGDTYFRDIFNGGERDLFDELTPVLYPNADKATMPGAQWKELRIRVKAYVYGLSYGREAGSIASEYNIPRAEAVRGMQAFFEVIPEIVAFREETRQRVLSGEDLVTPWGRHRRYMLITKENVHDVMNEALAFLPQSTASDMCLQALTWLRPELKGKAYIRNTIHDAIIAECRREDAEEVASIMDKRMVESAATIVGDYVRFATESKIGMHWGEL
jgi:DNA polymerase-1